MVEEDKDDISEDKFEAWTARMLGGRKGGVYLRSILGYPHKKRGPLRLST
jgi:hypothetical protein